MTSQLPLLSSACTYCQRPVSWAKDSSGRNVCISPYRSARGTYALKPDGTVVLATPAMMLPRHAAHYLSCVPAKKEIAGMTLKSLNAQRDSFKERQRKKKYKSRRK